MISEYKTKTKKKLNKKFMIPLMAIFVIGMVFAVGYIVNSLTLTVGVAEPFTVQYAVIGDAGTWDGVTTCDSEGLTWFTSTSESIPTGNFYPLEQRVVCIKIHNLGEKDIPYTVTSAFTNDNDNLDCFNAFGNPSLSGSALAESDTVSGVVVTISADAKPVEGCRIKIDTARG